MKSITIPKYNNPFTVNINNKEYTYKGGETIEVPDEVAEAIEDALELVPKPKRYLSTLALRAQGSIESIAEGDLDGCTEIATYSFYMCKKMRSVKIPSGVVSIKERAFGGCDNLKTVTFAEDSQLETIEGGAFSYDYNLSSINIPKGVKTIGDSALAYCYGLNTITIPENVASIGAAGFSTCKGLLMVVMKATTPTTIQANTFYDIPAACVFKVPAESVEAYKAAPNWSALASRIVAIEE